MHFVVNCRHYITASDGNYRVIARKYAILPILIKGFKPKMKANKHYEPA